MSIGILTLGLRFWQLGDLPPGLYRDEAHNGLDSLNVLAGDHALFFESNNGREPAYIYLTAMSIAWFGRTALAVRLTAAIIGSLTTYPVYLLSREWFGQRVGLFAAFLWATTVWSIHLSRVGFRAVLMVPLVTLSAWLVTLAWRREHRQISSTWIWVLAGFVYALAFYTYLAIRLSPLLIVLLIICAWISTRRWLLKPILSFGMGWLLGIWPWIFLFLQSPDLFLGRTGQVSIFNADINGGAFWQTLFSQIASALGMFVWYGDDIIRHNPPGRPVFDVLMAIPFLIGVGWMLVHSRKPAVLVTLAWIGTMLWGTILAEDTPHFLRAVGILPVALFPAAIGLDQLVHFLERYQLPNWSKLLLMCSLLAGSVALTVRDYYLFYGPNQETAYLFEAAARDLAEDIEAYSLEREILLDQTLANGWPSVEFLRSPNKSVKIFDASADVPQFQYNSQPLSLFYYPYGVERLAQPLINNLERGDLIFAQGGSWARNDLDPQAFQLYVELGVEPQVGYLDKLPLAVWGLDGTDAQLILQEVSAELRETDQLDIQLVWTVQAGEDEKLGEYVAFVHVLDNLIGGLAGQSDSAPADNLIPTSLWRSERYVAEHREIDLSRPFDPATMQLYVGWYPAGLPADRLARADCLSNETSAACTLFEIETTRKLD